MAVTRPKRLVRFLTSIIEEIPSCEYRSYPLFDYYNHGLHYETSPKAVKPPRTQEEKIVQSRHTQYTTFALQGIPSTTAYLELTSPLPTCVKESSPQQTPSFSERHLQCVWADSRLRPKSITSREGDMIKVIDPGQWNLEAGPDFLNAILLIGPDQRRIQGDVEIHIAPADWNHHKHAEDPHYQRVVAHVTYTAGKSPLTSLPPGTVEISLKEEISAQPSFSFESIDLTAYPYSVLPETPRPCAHELQKWLPERLGTLLEAAGSCRMQQKADKIAYKLKDDSPDNVIYRELLGALGYKQNTAVCRELAERVPYETIRYLDPLEGYAVLLGVANLLPARPSARWDSGTRAFIRLAWDAWWRQQAEWQHAIIPKATWTLSSVRPQNHPIRRLAAAATIACNPESISARLAEIDCSDTILWYKGIAELFVPAHPLDYWNFRISFGSPIRDNPVAILGKPRLSALCANVLLPFLAVTGHPTETLIKALPPEQNNSIIRQTAHALFGRDHNPMLYSKSALRQQGLMQIFHDFCIRDRSGCEECALPSALKMNYH